MLICPSCQSKYPIGDPACSRCGTKQDQVRCLACGNWVSGESGRCPHCRVQLPVFLLMLGEPDSKDEKIAERYVIVGELGEGEYLVQDQQFNLEVPNIHVREASSLVREYARLANASWLPRLIHRMLDPRSKKEILFIEPRLNSQGIPLPTIVEFWSNLRDDERIRLLRQWLAMLKAIAPDFRRTIFDPDNLVIGNYRLLARKLLPGEEAGTLLDLSRQWEKLFGNAVKGPLRRILERMQETDASCDEISALLGQLLKEPHIRWEHFAATDVGKLRDHNEDNFFGFTQTFQRSSLDEAFCRTGGLYTVCDGMGGHEGGEIASAMAVDSIEKKLLPALISPDLSPNDLQALLTRSIKQDINQPIFEANLAAGIPEQRRMGCTLILMLALGKRAVSVHVGDSRLYYVSKEEIQPLTQDHNVANLEYQLGHLTEEERDRISSTGIGKALTQAIGPREEDYLYPEVQFYDIDNEGIFLLCSDGLTDMVPDPLIQETVSLNWESLEEAGKALIELANERGGADNITVMLVRALPEPDLFS